MKPIIFVRVADMKYYKGITAQDSPTNGGAYVTETGDAHECYNFDTVEFDDGKIQCLGFALLTGRSSSKTPQLRIENIVGCELFKKEEKVEDVTVVWCSKAHGSKNMRVVGFYKHATVFREYQYQPFSENYIQAYNFIADNENCILLPYRERHSNSKWYVPSSQRNMSTFGFGRASVWYGGNNTDNEKEIDYVERMLKNIDEYEGENWIDKGGVQ